MDEERPHKTVNQLVNEALLRWAAVTKVDPDDDRFSVSFNGSEAYSNYDLVQHLEALNESRTLDPTGVTTLMMLRGLTENHLKTHAFSAYELLMQPANCKSQLDAMRDLRDLVEDPDYVAVLEGFTEELRKAADHYGVPNGRGNKELNELLEDRYELAYVRRDALRSIETLEAKQFTHGSADPRDLKYNKSVFEFWNINSLLKAMLGQGIAGISLCLIRDPEEALASFFVFAIRNGETLTILTDKSDTPHPEFNRMSRNPGRMLEGRAAKNRFPYHLLKLQRDSKGKLFESVRKDLVPYDVKAVPLSKIGQLKPDEFVWLVLMFDLIQDRYWKENKQLPETCYTGEMIVKPNALIGETSALVKEGLYKPLIVPPLEMKDVSLKATKKQWYRKSTKFNLWMEERYETQVPVEVLNPVGNAAGEALKALGPVQSLLEEEDYRIKGALDRFGAMSPLAFGTKEDLERDRQWHGRVNKMRVIQALAIKEFQEESEKTENWFYSRIRKNQMKLIEAMVRRDLQLPLVSHHSKRAAFIHGYQRVKKTNLMYVSVEKMYRRSYYAEQWLCGGIRGRVAKEGALMCVLNPDVKATVFGFVMPSCPEAIAILCDCEVKDLPFGLQHYFKSEPYTGNSILDRVEPSDWVLENPWMKLDLQVCIALCRRSFHAKRKELGLPPLELTENMPSQPEDNQEEDEASEDEDDDDNEVED